MITCCYEVSILGIGKRIKEARLRKGYTQAALANLIGVTSGAIGNYENETSHPKEEVLYKLINTLEVDANYLFQDEMAAIKEKPATTDGSGLTDEINLLVERLQRMSEEELLDVLQYIQFLISKRDQ